MAFNRSHGGWFHWEICVTFKNWLLDLWLTFNHGRWEVMRIERTVLSSFDDFRAQVKQEGTEICYDPSVKYDYYACNKRTAATVLCPSKREAESCCAFWNDMRQA